MFGYREEKNQAKAPDFYWLGNIVFASIIEFDAMSINLLYSFVFETTSLNTYSDVSH